MTKRVILPPDHDAVKFRDVAPGTIFQNNCTGIYIKTVGMMHYKSHPYNAVLIGSIDETGVAVMGNLVNFGDEAACWIIPEATFKLGRRD